jgi:hypothetical protein
MMRPNTPDWSDAEKATLRRLWDDSNTARQISKAMGRSRAAVCGMARRLKLSSRQPHQFRPKVKPAPPRAPIHSKLSNKPETVAVVPSQGLQRGAAWEAMAGAPPVSLLNLEPGMCKWPIGDEKPFMFCGHPAVAGAYCQHHHDWSVGIGSSFERAAIKFAVDANKDEWRQGERARERQYA